MGRDDTAKCQYCSAQVQELALSFHEDNCSQNPANIKDD